MGRRSKTCRFVWFLKCRPLFWFQESIGVKMLLIQDSQSVSAQPKPLRISGSADKVEQARRAVELLLNNDENNRIGGGGGNQGGGGGMMMMQQRSIGEVIVPRSSVGIIIGKGQYFGVNKWIWKFRW